MLASFMDIETFGKGLISYRNCFLNRYITERKSSLHNWSGQICPYSLRATFQRELMDLEEGVYFFSKLY